VHLSIKRLMSEIDSRKVVIVTAPHEPISGKFLEMLKHMHDSEGFQIIPLNWMDKDEFRELYPESPEISDQELLELSRHGQTMREISIQEIVDREETRLEIKTDHVPRHDWYRGFEKTRKKRGKYGR